MLVEKLVDDNHIDIEKEHLTMIENLILGNKNNGKYRHMGNQEGN